MQNITRKRPRWQNSESVAPIRKRRNSRRRSLLSNDTWLVSKSASPAVPAALVQPIVAKRFDSSCQVPCSLLHWRENAIGTRLAARMADRGRKTRKARDAGPRVRRPYESRKETCDDQCLTL